MAARRRRAITADPASAPPRWPPLTARAELGRAYAQAAWQILADAARLGVIRHDRAEARAGGAVVALVRVNGVLGAGGALSAQEVADELDVTLDTLAVTERELARALNLTRYARRLPAARGRRE